MRLGSTARPSLSVMARRSCRRKQIVSVAFKVCGRGRSKICPVAKLHKDDRRPTIKTKGGGRLVDGGVRLLGGYKTKTEAQKAAAKWLSKHNHLVC